MYFYLENLTDLVSYAVEVDIVEKETTIIGIIYF